MMMTKNIEDVVIQCGQLLMQSSAVDSKENKEAVQIAAESLKFCGLEMKRLDADQQTVIQSICFLDSEEADPSNAMEFRYSEDHGGSAVYRVYPKVGQEKWSERTVKWLGIFMMQLHEANSRQNLVEDAQYYRYHDPLTKHTNLLYYSERCDLYIKNGTICDYTAIAVDLDDFTQLNLRIGSDNCDLVLTRFLDWLKDGLTDNEIVSRISGDRSALLVLKEHEDMILEKLKHSEIRYGENPNEKVNLSAEAGIYHLSEDVESHHNIIQAISSTLNTAKGSMHLQFAYYDRASAEELERKKFYESAFEQALINEDIHVFFQPKVSLKDYELIGAEALSRWIVDGKMVPPDSFIPILEETNRICELDFYVLEHVCQCIQSWIRHGVKPVKVSVNFSRRHLSDKNLVSEVIRILDKYEVPHEYIEMELTETTIDADFEALKRVVHDLRGCGIESSVDDFGMGYSSLSLIRDVPFKVLKIDKSFLGDKNAESEERQRSMMKHVISMANDMGMECIAEGVESMEHVQLLKENKCYMAQGFLFNKPIPQEEFEDILSQQLK